MMPLRRALQPPPRHLTRAQVAALVLAGIALAFMALGCKTDKPKPAASVPAWTNAAPYGGARGPSW